MKGKGTPGKESDDTRKTRKSFWKSFPRLSGVGFGSPRAAPSAESDDIRKTRRDSWTSFGGPSGVGFGSTPAPPAAPGAGQTSRTPAPRSDAPVPYESPYKQVPYTTRKKPGKDTKSPTKTFPSTSPAVYPTGASYRPSLPPEDSSSPPGAKGGPPLLPKLRSYYPPGANYGPPFPPKGGSYPPGASYAPPLPPKLSDRRKFVKDSKQYDRFSIDARLNMEKGYFVEFENVGRNYLQVMLKLIGSLTGGDCDRKEFKESLEMVRASFPNLNRMDRETDTCSECPVITMTAELPKDIDIDASLIPEKISLAFKDPCFFGLTYDDVKSFQKLVNYPSEDEETDEEVEEPSLEDVLSWDTKLVTAFDDAYYYLQLTRRRRMECIDILKRHMDKLTESEKAIPKKKKKKKGKSSPACNEIELERNGIAASANCLYNAHFAFTTLKFLEKTAKDTKCQLLCNSEVMEEFGDVTDEILNMIPKILSHICAPSAHREDVYEAKDATELATGITPDEEQPCALTCYGMKPSSQKRERILLPIKNIPQYGLTTESQAINGYAITNFRKWFPGLLRAHSDMSTPTRTRKVKETNSPSRAKRIKESFTEGMRSLSPKREIKSPKISPLESDRKSMGSGSRSEKSMRHLTAPEANPERRESFASYSDTYPLSVLTDDQVDYPTHSYRYEKPDLLSTFYALESSRNQLEVRDESQRLVLTDLVDKTVREKMSKLALEEEAAKGDSDSS